MENQDFSKMAQFISTLRKEKQLTQKDLAEQLGVTDKAVSKWERGLNCPDISLLTKLASILGVTPSELLNGERAPSPAPEIDAVVESTLRYADSSSQNIRSRGNRWKSLALTALTLLLAMFVYRVSQRAIESGSDWMIFPVGLTGFIWLVVLAGVFALGKNKLATVLLCGFLIAVTTHIYTLLNQESLNNPASGSVATGFPTLFIPHYAVIITLLILSVAILVTSFLIQKKTVSTDLVFLLAGLDLTILILSALTVSAIMDYVDLYGLGVNPRYSVLQLPTFLMTLLSLAMLARRQIRQNAAENKPIQN